MDSFSPMLWLSAASGTPDPSRVTKDGRCRLTRNLMRFSPIVGTQAERVDASTAKATRLNNSRENERVLTSPPFGPIDRELSDELG